MEEDEKADLSWLADQTRREYVGRIPRYEEHRTILEAAEERAKHDDRYRRVLSRWGGGVLLSAIANGPAPTVPKKVGLVALLHPAAWFVGSSDEPPLSVYIAALSVFTERLLYVTQLSSRWIIVSLKPWPGGDTEYLAEVSPDGGWKVTGLS